ncbi:hypothetical protein L798_01974, partial [Zootermopsis nevadensis]
RKEQRRRRIWMKDYLKKRNFGILKDLEVDEEVLFRNFTRMPRPNFNTLLEIVAPKIAKRNTHFREAIPVAIKLAITLRFLATGDSFASL